MMHDFSPLRDALRRCRAAGVDVPIWWRDDDAVQPTAALDRLISMATATGVPVHLAIIPKKVDQTLPAYLIDAPCIPVVHGWSHTVQIPPESQKSEFGNPRPDAKPELEQGFDRMRSLFPQLAPVFVPPWNRIDAGFFDTLHQLGYEGVSTFGNRASKFAADGLQQINTHVDPIFWKQTRDLVPPEQLIAATAAILDARCDGTADKSEPLGLLTHHLVHSEAVWRFSEDWLHEMLDGGAMIKRNLLEP